MTRRLGLGLTALTFLIGLALGAVDARTTHLALSPAHAQPNGGGGGPGRGGCDGHGAAAHCSSCDGHDCSAVCVGAEFCPVAYPGGVKTCHTDGPCTSGGGSGATGGLTIY
jgi:hypothetical protein